jgi:hypothetical protein
MHCVSNTGGFRFNTGGRCFNYGGRYFYRRYFYRRDAMHCVSTTCGLFPIIIQFPIFRIINNVIFNFLI